MALPYKPPKPKTYQPSLKVPTGMTAADYGKSIAQQVYGSQNPVNQPKAPLGQPKATGGVPAGYVPIRSTVEAGGGSVGWDANKGVSINGNFLNRGDYTNVGGTTYARPSTLVSGFTSAPKAPTFEAPNYNVMGYQQALGQAQAQYQPLQDQARTNAGATNQQQQGLLRQQLNANGNLDGGGAAQGAMNLSGQLQSTLSNIDTDYGAKAAELAQILQQRSADEQNQLYNRALQTFGTQYQGYRDNAADQQWQQNFGEQQRQFNATTDEQQRQFNVGAAADLSDKFGIGVLPKSNGQYLFEQVAGRPTVAKTTADNNWQYQQGQLANDAYNNETGRMNAGTNAFSAQTDADYKQGSLAIDAAKLGQGGGEAITKAITYANGAIDKLTVGQPDSLDPSTTKQVALNPTNKASLKEHFRTALNAITSAGGDPSVTLSQKKQDLYDNYGKYEGNILYNLLQGAVGSLGE